MIFFCIFFFFQAEDGIRDLYVTGVQTCALPICQRVDAGPAAVREAHLAREHARPGGAHVPGGAGVAARAAVGVVGLERSEEHTSELQSRRDLVCRLLLEKKKQTTKTISIITTHD